MIVIACSQITCI